MEWISDIYQDAYSENQFSDRVLLIFSVLNSITGLGSILGIVFIAPWSDRYGRRFVLAISTVSNIVYSVLIFISKPLHSIVPMMIGRVIIGIPLSLQSNILVYLNEMTSIQRRGIVMSWGLFWFRDSCKKEIFWFTNPLAVLESWT